MEQRRWCCLLRCVHSAALLRLLCGVSLHRIDPPTVWPAACIKDRGDSNRFRALGLRMYIHTCGLIFLVHAVCMYVCMLFHDATLRHHANMSVSMGAIIFIFLNTCFYINTVHNNTGNKYFAPCMYETNLSRHVCMYVCMSIYYVKNI